VRNALVAALTSCADRPSKNRARRFLSGLSFDELQFIAEFQGACVLESGAKRRCSRAQLAERIAEFQRARESAGGWSEDRDHKMILLLEYLCRDRRQFTMARAGNA
jgi:hypothetical protein